MLAGHAMPDDKHDPVSDVIRGLGLLLRAAKTTVEKVPTKGLEDAVLETAREVGRAIENVADTLEREVFRRPRGDAPRTRVDTEGEDGERRDPKPPGDPPKPPPDAA